VRVNCRPTYLPSVSIFTHSPGYLVFLLSLTTGSAAIDNLSGRQSWQTTPIFSLLDWIFLTLPFDTYLNFKT